MSKSKKDHKKKKSKKSSKQKKTISKESNKSSDRTSSEKESSTLKTESILKEEDTSKVIVKFKSSKRGPIQQGRQKLYPLIECYDSDDVIEFDASKVTQDPGTIYEAASQIFTRLAFTQKQVDLVFKQSSDLIKSLDFFCKAQLTLLNQQVTQMRHDIKTEIKAEGAAPTLSAVNSMMQEVLLSKESVHSYLARFELINNKIKKLEPLLQFRPPQFQVPTDLKVIKRVVNSPFVAVGPIGAAVRFIGKLQSKDIEDLGLVAINTAERTCIGRFDVVDDNGEILKTQQTDNDQKMEDGEEKPTKLEFTLRKVLCKRYSIAICHGSRLICDTDVYNKNYVLQQNLAEIPTLNQNVYSYCSYDKEYLFAGLSHYYVGLLKFSHETNMYSVWKTIRFEKAHNIEGNVLHIERLNHLPSWFMCITFRSFRLFKIVEEVKENDPENVLLRMPVENRKVLRDTIRLGFLRVQQHGGNVIMLSMGGVTMIKVTEDGNAFISNTVNIVRTDRVGLFPGYCSDNFPFLIAQVGDFNGDQFLAQQDIKYLGWVSVHLGMQQESEIPSNFGEFRPQIYDFRTKSLVGIDEEGQIVQLQQAQIQH